VRSRKPGTCVGDQIQWTSRLICCKDIPHHALEGRHDVAVEIVADLLIVPSVVAVEAEAQLDTAIDVDDVSAHMKECGGEQKDAREDGQAGLRVKGCVSTEKAGEGALSRTGKYSRRKRAVECFLVIQQAVPSPSLPS